MRTAFALCLLLTLSACSNLASRPAGALPCDLGEATYACQVQRYNDVSA